MTEYPRIAEIVPEGVSGNVRLEHFEVKKVDSDFTRLRAAIGHRDEYVPPGKYARLVVNGTLMMTDTPMEQRTNHQVIYNAFGHVLIAGLGLGMILHPICCKPDVTKVTVVEMSPDVAKLVGPYLPKKVEVVVQDIFEYRPAKGTKFDTLYFDIWPSICTDNLEDMAKLHRRFAHYKTKGAWMDSWCRSTLLARRARERRDPWNRIMGRCGTFRV